MLKYLFIFIILLELSGALTSKIYAFQGRNWETKRYSTVDLFDSLCSNIEIIFKQNNFMKILPKSNKNFNFTWISDKIRYVFDSLKFQRIIYPYIKMKFNSLLKKTYVYIKTEIYFILDILLDLLNLIIYLLNSIKKLNFIGFLGNMLNLQTIYLFKKFLYIYGSDSLYNLYINKNTIKSDIKNNYNFNSYINGLDIMDSCFLFFFNPRYESPLLNIKIKKKNLDIYSFGYFLNLSLKIKQINLNFFTLFKLLEANNKLSYLFIYFSKPLLIFGTLFFYFFEYFNSIILLLKKFTNFFILNNWNGLNFFNNFSNYSNILEFSYNYDAYLKLNWINFKKENIYNIYIVLLGSENNNKKKKKKDFFFSQIYHKNLLLFKSDLIIPSNFSLEEFSSFINIENIIQNIEFINNILHIENNNQSLIFNNYNIIIFFFKSFINEFFINIINKFNLILTQILYILNKIFNNIFSSFISNYFISDVFSKFSKNLQLINNFNYV